MSATATPEERERTLLANIEVLEKEVALAHRALELLGGEFVCTKCLSTLEFYTQPILADTQEAKMLWLKKILEKTTDVVYNTVTKYDSRLLCDWLIKIINNIAKNEIAKAQERITDVHPDQQTES